jgi:hypothetical protein
VDSSSGASVAEELWVIEYVVNYEGMPVCTVSIVEFEKEKCRRET